MTDVTENLICVSSYILLWTFIPFSLTSPSLFCALLPQQKRFLRCSPFDEFNLWRSQVDNGSKKGGERLSILTKSLLLRRTKDQLDSTGRPLVIKFIPVPGGGREGAWLCPCLGLNSHLLCFRSLWLSHPPVRRPQGCSSLPSVTAIQLYCMLEQSCV